MVCSRLRESIISFLLVALFLFLCSFLCITKHPTKFYQLHLFIYVCIAATIKNLHIGALGALRVLLVLIWHSGNIIVACVQHAGFIKNCHLQKKSFRDLGGVTAINGNLP